MRLTQNGYFRAVENSPEIIPVSRLLICDCPLDEGRCQPSALGCPNSTVYCLLSGQTLQYTNDVSGIQQLPVCIAQRGHQQSLVKPGVATNRAGA